MKYTTENFIKKAKEKHGDKYDYSKVEYVNSTTLIKIICKEHGEFEQIPSSHLRGYNCPLCGNINRGKSSNTEEFIKRAVLLNGDTYDYSRVEYVNSETPVSIICKKHGEFSQRPMQHLLGQGCPKCAGRGLSLKDILGLFREKHGNKYDYSKVVYTKMHDKVDIICPTHGIFSQTPSKHINGQGCPKCGKISCTQKLTSNVEDFVTKSNLMHNEKYDYSNVHFVSMSDKVEIVCPKHGSFFQRPYDHVVGHGCPKCANTMSKPEEEIVEMLKNVKKDITIIRNDRSILNGKEIDIYLPEFRFGIEYNGLRWHSEYFGKDKNYHLNKMVESNNSGIRLIQVFEDEYNSNKELVFNKILHILGLSKGEKVMARKCNIIEISKDVSKEFLSNFHIQGYNNSSVSIGCYYNDALIAVMTFIKRSGEKWELNRFASDYHYVCLGVGGKMFKYFLRRYNPIEVKSFADRRWTTNCNNNLYTKIGFSLVDVLKPDYSYIEISNPIKRIHKFNIRKNAMNSKYDLPLTMTESEMAKTLNLDKVWNCGLYKYVYYNR